jgi:hypothetical protein
MAFDEDKVPFLFNNQRENPDIETIKGIYLEATYLYGTDCKYIRRELTNENVAFGEFRSMILAESTDIRLFVEQLEQFDGAQMYTKFGLQLNDEATMFGPKILFENKGIMPKPNDIIYHVPSQRLFEVTHVDDEKNGTPFYMLGENTGYRLQCAIYQHDYSEISDDVIDAIPEMAQFDEQNADDTAVNNEEYEGEAGNYIDETERDPLAK